VGEGGGQIVRTVAAFSAVTGWSVKIINIRAKRIDSNQKICKKKNLF